MNTEKLIASLERFGRVLPVVVRDVSPEDARWKPADGAWSILEIVRHLLDEEVEDFRTRVRLTLEKPAEDWPGIHPAQWAVQRRYNDGELNDAVAKFVAERDASVKWLRGLKNPDWSSTHAHPKFGSMRAGDLLAAWAAHDSLHLRQIAKRLHQMAARDAEGFSTGYAGDWVA